MVGSLVNLLFSSIWGESLVNHYNRSAKRLLIVSANFSWMNHGQFAKLVKLAYQLAIWYSAVRLRTKMHALVLIRLQSIML